LKSRNEALDAFAHTLAHDIKNSVAIINGFSMYIDESLDIISDDEIRESLQLIVKTGNKVNHIIQSLLLFSSIGRENVPFAPVMMGLVVNSALDRLKNQIKEKNARLIVPVDFPVAIGYEGWIEEIWFNYIANAIKYGGNPPVIEIGATISDNDYIAFWVKDNGRGISPEVQNSIFEVYQSRKDKTKGYGLGLSIVKRIVEKLHGRVGVKNNPDGGSTFSFSLPSKIK
jgi:signal transduction histidine kinase